MRGPARKPFCVFALGLTIAVVFGAQALAADSPDPAVAQIDSFDRSLLETMRQGPSLGAMGRYRKLAPAVERAFDLPMMTRFAVGPPWATMSEADHQALIGAFTRLSVASYAHNFAAFGGERLEVDPRSQTRGADKIVQSHLIPAHGAPVALTYRMHGSGGSWRIIDVYYGAVSQLTTRRADFAAPLASGGAKGLVAHLNALSDNLLR
jgi:phospholipid transport system substrate-binding protein